MNRKSFMAELRSLLAFLDAAERERVLNRYERMFDEAGPEGEAAVIRCFGSPVRQVLQIEREYREAVASGETPFADGDSAAAPEETEIIEEEYAGEHVYSGETEPKAEETLPEEVPEEQPEEPAETVPAEAPASAPEEAAYAVLPEIDFDDLDFSDLGLTFPKKTAAPVIPAVPEEPEQPEIPVEIAEDEEPAGEPLPEKPEEAPEEEQPRVQSTEEIFADLLAVAAAEPLPEGETDEPSTPEETEKEEEPSLEEPAETEPVEEAPEETETAEPAEPETLDVPETPEVETTENTEIAEELPEEDGQTADETAENAPAEEPVEEDEAEEEYEYEEIEERRPVSGGRVFAAVVVTIPMLVVWALLFGLSLGLGIAVLGIGAALVAAGVYLTGYVFNGAIVRMPDLLLTAGAALAVFALALLLLWTGVSIAVAGCTLTVRLTRGIYRSILYPKKEENADE